MKLSKFSWLLSAESGDVLVGKFSCGKDGEKDEAPEV